MTLAEFVDKPVLGTMVNRCRLHDRTGYGLFNLIAHNEKSPTRFVDSQNRSAGFGFFI